MGAETALGRDAVALTRGQVVTYQGELIDAFYSSTCGGRTSIGTEIFKGANRPYLRSIDDAPKGRTGVLQHLTALHLARGVEW